MEYTYHQDPGHGWIEVPLEELHRLQITLEEDCDAGAWARAKREAGESFTLIDRHTNHDHPIRHFQSFGA